MKPDRARRLLLFALLFSMVFSISILIVRAQPSFEVYVSVTPEEVNVDESATVSVTVDNTGTAKASDVTVELTITGVRAEIEGESTQNVGTLEPGNSATAEFTVTFTSGGTGKAIGTVTCKEVGGEHTGEATFTVIGAAAGGGIPVGTIVMALVPVILVVVLAVVIRGMRK